MKSEIDPLFSLRLNSSNNTIELKKEHPVYQHVSDLNLLRDEFSHLMTDLNIDIHYYDIYLLIDKLKGEFNDTYRLIESLKQKDFSFLSGVYNYSANFNSVYVGTVNNSHMLIWGDLVNVYNKYLNSFKSLLLSTEPNNINKTAIQNIHNSIADAVTNTFDSYVLLSKAYIFERTYETYSLDNNIKAFSHRRRGWGNPMFSLNEFFKIEIKSNFGYGSSSYFYTCLYYKDLSLATYSDLISYEYAFSKNIINYTKTYDLDYDCWIDAFEYAKDACNLALHDENLFFNKYIINECIELVNGLDTLLHSLDSNKFNAQFKDNNSIIEKSFIGHSLWAYVSQKISDAISFIADIKRFDSYQSVHQYIDKITLINKTLYDRIKNILPVFENEKNNIELNYNKIVVEYSQLENLILNINRRIDRAFNFKYPNPTERNARAYSMFYESYFKSPHVSQSDKDAQIKISKLKNEKITLEFDLKLISKNIDSIKASMLAIMNAFDLNMPSSS